MKMNQSRSFAEGSTFWHLERTTRVSSQRFKTTWLRDMSKPSQMVGKLYCLPSGNRRVQLEESITGHLTFSVSLWQPKNIEIATSKTNFYIFETEQGNVV